MQGIGLQGPWGRRKQLPNQEGSARGECRRGATRGTDFYHGERLREGPAIVQYIADQVPDKQLAPANGTLARYRLQEWLTFIGTELHKGFSPLFNPATPEDYKPMVRERLLQRLQWVDGQLAGKQYLMGDQFTVADGYLFPVTK